MYYLFRYKSIMPSQFEKMSMGERLIIRQFVEYELENR